MSNDNVLHIRPATLSEFQVPLKWAADEGWNPGYKDAQCYLKADPQGFLIGYLGDTPAASISMVRYSTAFAFLGFYMVHPNYRGKGFGLQIWNAGLAYAKGCNIGLDGVVAQQENYKKAGFSLAYRNIRFVGKSIFEKATDKKIVAITRDMFADIAHYDRAFFPANRDEFLKSWVSVAGHKALALIEQGNIAGYGVVRPCIEGYKIGPLYADNRFGAQALLEALMNSIPPDSTIFLDVPENNTAAVALAESFGMSTCFETARMYTGKTPRISIDRLFGVTSFEIG